ncbi:MAG: uroporphyrinogen-III synthase [Actinomycetota bacterium]|nr:uroporphyrinogen-III synthase [Actinomycetota bacterium]
MIVTRAKHQARELIELLEAAGAEVLAFPVIETVEPEDWGPADEAIRNLEVYDWVVFTSANAVRCFFDRLAHHGSDARQLAGCRVAAVGSSTETRLAARGILADFVPDDFRAEGLLEGFAERGVGSGVRVLVPRALEAREVLPETLRERGALVDVVPVYRTVRGQGDPVALARMARGDVDVVTFTSPSTLRHFLAIAAETPARDALDGTALASIGSVTSDAARELGLRVDIEANPFTVQGLVTAIEAWAAS